MATIVKRKSKAGIEAFQVKFSIDGKRPTVTLSQAYSRTDAEEVERLGDKIIDSIRYGIELDVRTKRQIDQLTPDLRKRFENAGLLEKKEPVWTVGKLTYERYRHAEQIGKASSTLTNYDRAEKWIFRYFGEDKPITEISDIDAESFKAWLGHQTPRRGLGKTLSTASVAGVIRDTKSLFQFARKKRLIDVNPFEFVQKGSFQNRSRQFFVPAEWFPNILDACPSQEWRVLIALARFGGLRTPSEPFLLKWSDILWDRGRFYVTSPKTKNHSGHEGRFCPLFLEIRRELEDLLTVKGNPAGSDFVLGDMKARCSAMNLRTTFLKIIKRAGYQPWEKLFNNLRVTRDTELKRAGFTEDQRTAWFGHSESISQDHYQIVGALVTDADFDRAIRSLTIPTSANGANATEAPRPNLTILLPTNGCKTSRSHYQDKTEVHFLVPFLVLKVGKWG